MAKFDAVVSGDKRITELRYVQADGAVVPMPLDAPNLEKMVAHLAEIRSQMIPAVPAEPTRMQHRLEGLQWRTGVDGATGGVGLQFRHPGLGWTTIVLDRSECAALIAGLRQSLETVVQASESKH